MTSSNKNKFKNLAHSTNLTDITTGFNYFENVRRSHGQHCMLSLLWDN